MTLLKNACRICLLLHCVARRQLGFMAKMLVHSQGADFIDGFLPFRKHLLQNE